MEIGKIKWIEGVDTLNPLFYLQYLTIFRVLMTTKTRNYKKAIRELLLANQKNKCFYCGCKLVTPTDDTSIKNSATIDHIKKDVEGNYIDSISNYVICCRSCNCSKSHKTLRSFRSRCFFREMNIPDFTVSQLDWLEENIKEFAILKNKSLKYKFYGEK